MIWSEFLSVTRVSVIFFYNHMVFYGTMSSVN